MTSTLPPPAKRCCATRRSCASWSGRNWRWQPSGRCCTVPSHTPLRALPQVRLLRGTSPFAAAALIRDAVDLRHRHPLLWAALERGHGRVWKARQIARLASAAGLTREQAWFVDAATTPYLDSLTWSAFTRLVEARIIEADPAAAEQRRQAAALARFVTTGRSTEHGFATLVARAGAGEVLYFVAVCDRIAQILALRGDHDPVEVRRSKALAILANPAAALTLLEQHTTDEPHPDDPDRSPLSCSDPDPDQDRSPDEPSPGRAPEPRSQPQADLEPQAGIAPGAGRRLDGAPAVSARAARDGAGSNRCASCGGPRISPEWLRPRAVLHVRVSEHALRSGHGVAHVDNGIGPVALQALTDLLGHSRVSVRPVLDLAGQVPVDAYEVPHAMREALRLARPSSVFPWTHTSAPDIDHTRPYLPRHRGGPPGQTAIGNLGPLSRFGHRVKTHAPGWVVRQPRPAPTCGARPTTTGSASTTTAPIPSVATPPLSSSPHAPRADSPGQIATSAARHRHRAPDRPPSP